MTFGDAFHYVTIGNPVSKVIIGTTASLVSKGVQVVNPKPSNMPKNVLPPVWKMLGPNFLFVRLAGISGASAVILGAVGSHHLTQEKPDLRNVFETANRFHFFHSLALLGVPLAKYPFASGSLMVLGTALFSGTLYYRAFTGNKPPFKQMAPMGGTCLILAWLSLLL